MQWLDDHPRPNAGTVSITADHKNVVVYWKGDPPADLQQFVSGLPIPVAIRKAAYSRAELVAVAVSLVEANHGVVTSAGPNDDFSGVGVSFSSKALPIALAAVRAQTAVPVESRGIQDIQQVSGRATNNIQTVCPFPARCGDGTPFCGGGLMHHYGTEGGVCSIGATSMPDLITTSPRHGIAARAIGTATTAA
jgi:hypothetical protein